MKEKENILDPLLEKVEDLGKTNLELFKLNVIDKTSDIVSTLLPYVVLVWSLILLVMFLCFGAAFWLGGIWGSLYLGFFAVAAFCGVCGVIIHFVIYDKLKERVRNTVIKQLLK